MKFPLVGNERIKAAVENILVSGRLPHAILIEGPAGSGKSTLAAYLCRAAVCTGSNPPCGECRNCRLEAGGNHPDTFVVSPQKDRKTITVNMIRELVTDAYVLPQESSKKVFIIDPADAMNDSAQNALLKILEEPPESVVFILTATSKTALLSTILSRCFVFNLINPENQTAIEYISSITKKEPELIADAVNRAHGSIGGALNLLKKKSATAASDLATGFFEAIKKGNRYELMKMTLPLEKDRAKTFDFYSELEILTASGMRGCTSPTLIKKYDRLYGVITEHKRLLKYNPNLSLLFSLLAIEATER